MPDKVKAFWMNLTVKAGLREHSDLFPAGVNIG
jgi:hypothetical protein